MRACILAFCTACLLIAPASASSGVKPEQGQKVRPEAVVDRYPEWWQGRQHYFFDETNSYRPQTDGSGSADPKECAEVLKRTDGVSVTRRSNKCDE